MLRSRYPNQALYFFEIALKIGEDLNDNFKIAENIKNIGVAFFTTKSLGVGTSLGLSVSYAIIQEHKGQIDVISKLKEGTTFVVTLPKNK